MMHLVFRWRGRKFFDLKYTWQLTVTIWRLGLILAFSWPNRRFLAFASVSTKDRVNHKWAVHLRSDLDGPTVRRALRSPRLAWWLQSAFFTACIVLAFPSIDGILWRAIALLAYFLAVFNVTAAYALARDLREARR